MNIVPFEYLGSLSYDDRIKMWQGILSKGTLVYAAENSEGQIVGFANGGKERTGEFNGDCGELFAVYIKNGDWEKISEQSNGRFNN
ncbi:hypothetical protein [Bacillus sp. M6-12]|uniref:hypothetical protein n=1 Tax=Bacillus sp. M6-12 TaxID=2054166 RepID=UPI0021552C11|nr:hypothetical protein [Bacillus sp. M6-12]